MRARNIKPGFWDNEDLGELSVEARLLFIGLWCMADRDGLLEDRPKKIKGCIFRFDDGINVPQLISDLERLGFVVRYEVDGSNYLQIVNFAKHQKPHYTEQASTIPAPPHFRKCKKPPVNIPHDEGEFPVNIPHDEGEFPENIPHDEGEFPEQDLPDYSLIPECGMRNEECGMRNPESIINTPNGVSSAEQPADLRNGHCPHAEIIKTYHEILPMMPRVQNWTSTRQSQLKTRWFEDRARQSIEWWRSFFDLVAKSDFLTGKTPGRNGGKPFLANLEWLTKAANFQKVVEGNYANRDQHNERWFDYESTADSISEKGTTDP